MAQSSQGREKEVIAFLSAQIDKINNTLQQHTIDLQNIHLLESKIEKQGKQQLQLEKHMKVLEVYQSQNFSNNQRLFNAQAQVDMLSSRLFVLEQLTQGFSLPEQTYDHNSQTFRALQIRVAQIEEQVARNRQKNQVLAKFRRDVSPVHCESTKDVSAEGNRQQLKKLERKLKEFVIERMAEFQKTFRQLKKSTVVKEQNDYENVVSRRISRHTKVKQVSIEDEDPIRNRISDYYQQTQKKEYTTDKGKERSKKQKQKSRRKREKKSKSKVKSSSKSLGNKSKRGRSSDGLNLVSVNEYLRLREYRQG